MDIERFEVCLAEVEWRNSIDRRPVVVLSPQWYLDEKTRDDVLVSLVSSAIPLVDQRCHFLVSSEDPEFDETGLTRSSYVAVDYITHLERAELKRRIGRLGEQMSARLHKFLADFLELWRLEGT